MVKYTIILKQRFRSSVRRGTGEAHLIIREYPKVDFSAEIIKVALHNYAYDAQSEGSRADYIFPLIKLSVNQNRIRNRILKALLNEHSCTWSLVQLFDLAKLYVLEGDAEAKNAIYDRFNDVPIEGSDWAGYEQIIEIDGFNGLKYIAEVFGRRLDADSNDSQDSGIISYFQRINPDIPVMNRLVQEGKTNQYIKIYLHKVKLSDRKVKKYLANQLPPVNKVIEPNYPNQVKKPNSSILKSRTPYKYLEPFIDQFEPQDEALLIALVQRSNDEYFIEELARCYVNIFTANPGSWCKVPLEAIYDKLNCALHRKDIVTILDKNGVLSEKIKAEINFDSYNFL